MIAAFGIPDYDMDAAVEVLPCEAVRGVHLTRLADDGHSKAGNDRDKIMLGSSIGVPIALSPVIESHGLAITEGIEDGLSVFAATGLWTWAAGSATRLPALGNMVPHWMAYGGCTSVFEDDDAAGRRGATELVIRLAARGLHAPTPDRLQIREACGMTKSDPNDHLKNICVRRSTMRRERRMGKNLRQVVSRSIRVITARMN